MRSFTLRNARLRAAGRVVTALMVTLTAVELTGCVSPSQCAESLYHDKLACRAWRQRKDCYGHESKQFKLGFLDGYIGAMKGGIDVCQPVVPPERYWSAWGCRGRDCHAVNSYYSGWGHGVIAAGQDGMAGYSQVPLHPQPKQAAPYVSPHAGPYGVPSLPHGGYDEAVPVPDVDLQPFPAHEGQMEDAPVDVPALEPPTEVEPKSDYFPPSGDAHGEGAGSASINLDLGPPQADELYRPSI